MFDASEARPGEIGAVLRREGLYSVLSDEMAYAARRGTAGAHEAGTSRGRPIRKRTGSIAG